MIPVTTARQCHTMNKKELLATWNSMNSLTSMKWRSWIAAQGASYTVP